LCRGCFVVQHWDGATWSQVPSPSPGPDSGLSGVAATSPLNAWAVGISDGSFIEHWDGTTWTRVASQFSSLYAVAVTSPANAWAVG
jgi:photosystem II stability/assembly factor-like uncharacterized protein